MDMNSAQAEVMPMAQVSLQLRFAVSIKKPVERPPRVYNISYQELMVKATSKELFPRLIYEILTEKVLADYNKFLEDCPIMDMFADPIKYEQCSYIEWIQVGFDGDQPVSLW